MSADKALLYFMSCSYTASGRPGSQVTQQHVACCRSRALMPTRYAMWYIVLLQQWLGRVLGSPVSLHIYSGSNSDHGHRGARRMWESISGGLFFTAQISCFFFFNRFHFRQFILIVLAARRGGTVTVQRVRAFLSKHWEHCVGETVCSEQRFSSQ